MIRYDQFEKDERQSLRKIVDDMCELHANMGGRDHRPERVALLKAMDVLDACINELTLQYIEEELNG